MIDGAALNLSLDELAAAAARHLAAIGVGEARDRRVSESPDARTVRYYTTLGLLDRPTIEGRQARYGRRHLLQLLAVKALQAESLPLAEIQARLFGRTERELEGVLEAAAGRRRAAAPVPAEEGVRAVAWREVEIEPGLRIVATEGWSPTLDPETMTARMRAAVRALANGGGNP